MVNTIRKKKISETYIGKGTSHTKLADAKMQNSKLYKKQNIYANKQKTERKLLLLKKRTKYDKI